MITTPRWDHYPLVALEQHARSWLVSQANLGRAPKTVEAYGRALQDFLSFSAENQVDPSTAAREHVASYVRHLLTRPRERGENVRVLDSGSGLANATLQQRLTAVRLYYDYLIEEGLRADNPVGRGRYTAGRGFGGPRDRGLVPRYQKLPIIPSDEQWQLVLHAAHAESVRNRFMFALAYDAALRREELCSLEVGDMDPAYRLQAKRVGQPLTACSKSGQLSAVRVFFRDCQDWGWLPRRFDPRRVLATPRSLLSLMGPNPRVVADDVWAKLVWAGLNLTADDLIGPGDGQRGWYPFEMVRAVAVVWLFAGLRNDELRRLRVGCIRWQEPQPDATTSRPVCLLDVPANKTGPAFTKPVDRLVGEAIVAWEGVRHEQPMMVDRTTGELMSCLFAHRGQRVGQPYLNKTLIPILCHKAGVPEADARGTITSHRARATIATQLFNAKQPLTLFELQAWLGHRSPSSTQHYAKLSPTKLARAYADADYFARNVRTIDVLIDQDAIASGAAAIGEPWRLYDLGHGYCSYQFFEQCPHRMACAKCSFYIVKGSARAQLLEGKGNLLKMLQEIPLTDGERDAVEDGVTAFERLLENLADVPTPGGSTPRQLTSQRIGGSEP